MGIELSKSLQNSIVFHPQTVRDFIACYSRYRYIPVAGLSGLTAYFENVKNTKAATALKLSLKPPIDSNSDPRLEDASSVLWEIYSVDSVCYLQEIVSILILISSETWGERVGLLFDLFVAMGSDVLSYDDIILIAQISATAIGRIWDSKWESSELCALSEGLADDIFSKVGKDVEDFVSKSEFISWAEGRFKESRKFSNLDSLRSCYKSQFS